MRTQKVDSENVGLKLFETFSESGYDGTSMADLAKATGLKKASLYHRFPDGKGEMAGHALEIVEKWILQNIVSQAADHQVPVKDRLERVITSIDQLYNGGTKNCLLRTLSIGTDANVFQSRVKQCFNLLAGGFADLSMDMGVSPDTAGRNAELVNVIIQGALVLTRATGDNRYFKDSLERIPSLLSL